MPFYSCDLGNGMGVYWKKIFCFLGLLLFTTVPASRGSKYNARTVRLFQNLELRYWECMENARIVLN